MHEKINKEATIKSRRPFLRISLVVTLALYALLLSGVHAQLDPLPSWNDGASKQAIVAFVQAATDKSSPKFVPPEERIATFDNDGTLWCEQPMYFQLIFALDRVKALAPQHPEWRDKEPFALLLKGDVKGALAGGDRAIAEIIMVTHAGMTTAGFEQIVKDWLATAKHQKFKKPYTECDSFSSRAEGERRFSDFSSRSAGDFGGRSGGAFGGGGFGEGGRR